LGRRGGAERGRMGRGRGVVQVINVTE